MMNASYYNSPPYDTIMYSPSSKIYQVISGLFSMSGNLYLIFLFIRFHKLRSLQCNWLIIFLCISDVLIGKYYNEIFYALSQRVEFADKMNTNVDFTY
jgi:hypothetical protein